MNRKEKLEAIYQEMANKNRTFGCKYLVSDITDWGDFLTRENEGECLSFKQSSEDLVFYFWEEESKTYKLKEIIWHPVMIGDVISYLRKPFEKFVEWQPVGENWLVDSYSKNINNLLVKWFDTSTSIEEQDDECIDFVYSLIKK